MTADRPESAMERRMRLGRELADYLADVGSDALVHTHNTPRGYDLLTLEDGQVLGLDDDAIAYRHPESGEVWTVEVEVHVSPVLRGAS